MTRHRLSLLVGIPLTFCGAVGLFGASLVAFVPGVLALAYGTSGLLRPLKADRDAAGRVYSEERTTALVPTRQTRTYESWTAERFGRWSALYAPALDRWLNASPRIALHAQAGEWRPTQPVEQARDLLAAAWPHLDADEDKIRLGSELAPGSRSVTVQRVKYSAFIVTNRLADIQLLTTPRTPLLTAEETLLHDGTIPDLEHPSKCSNHVGVDVLACVDGNHLLITRQSGRTLLSRALWAPSGSGSADWSDLADEDLLMTVKRAMARETSEELGLARRNGRSSSRPAHDEIAITGYARLMHLAGKPQFYGVARFRSIEPVIAQAEGAYVDDHARIEFDSGRGPDGLDEAVAAFERASEGVISMPLHMSFLMLRRWLRDDDSAWTWLTGRVPSTDLQAP